MFSWIKTILLCWRNKGKKQRRLEIGPGNNRRIQGFETLGIENNPYIDYVWDCSKKLPFPNETFEIIYASHVLEHVPWYQSEQTLREWVRVLKKGGMLEVWVPDGVKICKVFVDAEINGNNEIHLDGWYKFNPEKDPCVWASGRIYTYGNGKGDIDDPNWHRAIFSERRLKALLEKVGLQGIRSLLPDEVRGDSHGWINLGAVGIKP